MDAILENDVSFNEFKTYFETLNVLKKKELVFHNLEVINDLRDADKLLLMCEQGFFNAIIPLIRCGNQEQLFRAFKLFYGGGAFANTVPSYEEEIELIKFASDKLYLIKYLRENTVVLDRYLGGKGHLITHLYTNASQEVVDYLFRWIVDNRVLIRQVDAKSLFARAGYKIVIDYIDYVRGLSGARDYVNYSMIVGVFNREDLTPAEKNHIMLYALNKMKVCPQSVTRLRKEGFL